MSEQEKARLPLPCSRTGVNQDEAFQSLVITQLSGKMHILNVFPVTLKDLLSDKMRLFQKLLK
jgi:hypothetical protein